MATSAKKSPYGSVKFTTINEYHASFPKGIRDKLNQMKSIIKSTAPKAEEVISYNMPAFKMNGILVYYAGYKAHIGFYPTGKPIILFKKELAVYKTSKGAIQFPLDEPLPVSLIKKIVKFRIEETVAKAKAKK